MSKRTDFEAALVTHLTKMMYWVAEKHGGINKILNDFLLTEEDLEFINVAASKIFYEKSVINSELSSDMIHVEIHHIDLDAKLQPHWTYAVHFVYDKELANIWHIKRMLIKIDDVNVSYQISNYFIGDLNKQSVSPEADDLLWDYFRKLVNGETYLKTMKFSKQSQL